MSEGHRVQGWQKWINSFKQQAAIAIKQVKRDISVAEFDIRDWYAIKMELNRIDEEIAFLYDQLSSLQVSPDSSPDEQSAAEKRRRAIRSEIDCKITERSTLRVRLQSRTEALQQWARVFGNESYYYDLGVQLQESKGKREEMAQYQKIV